MQDTNTRVVNFVGCHVAVALPLGPVTFRLCFVSNSKHSMSTPRLKLLKTLWVSLYIHFVTDVPSMQPFAAVPRISAGTRSSSLTAPVSAKRANKSPTPAKYGYGSGTMKRCLTQTVIHELIYTRWQTWIVNFEVNLTMAETNVCLQHSNIAQR
jgi:hypothetical protein